MRNPLFTSGDLGKFIQEELSRRGVTMGESRDLPELLASWRSHSTHDVPERPRSLVLHVRGCTFVDVANFCFALFAQFRKKLPHVLFTGHSATATTVIVDAQRKQTDQAFDFHISGGFGHFSRTHDGILVFLHRRKTATFMVAQSEIGLEIVFTDHETV